MRETKASCAATQYDDDESSSCSCRVAVKVRDVIKDVLSLTFPSGRSVCDPDLLNASSVCFCQEANVDLPKLLARSSADMMCQCGVEPQCHDGVRRYQCVGSMSNHGQIPVQLSSCHNALFEVISLRCVRIRLLL